MLNDWGFRDRDWLARVAVVVSELVTNAVLHGGGCLFLDLESHDDRITVAVADRSALVPETREADGTGGRGLLVIEAWSIRWGVHEHEGGKRVWVEL